MIMMSNAEHLAGEQLPAALLTDEQPWVFNLLVQYFLGILLDLRPPTPPASINIQLFVLAMVGFKTLPRQVCGGGGHTQWHAQPGCQL